MRLILALHLALLPFLIACTKQLPVRLTDQVAASTVEELTEKASKPVKGDGIYPASLIDEKTDETVRVDNAADLYRYLDRGYVLQSGVDHSMANIWK